MLIETKQTQKQEGLRRQQLMDRLIVLDKSKSELESKGGGLFSNNKKKIEELRVAQQHKNEIL